MLLDALRTLETTLQWHIQFYLVANHNRPCPVFQPAVVLVTELVQDQVFQVWPIPIAIRPGRPRGRGRGNGRGAAAGGRGRAKGQAKAKGRAKAKAGGSVDDIAEPLPVLDLEEDYDEAQDESDLDSWPGLVCESSEEEIKASESEPDWGPHVFFEVNSYGSQ